MSDVQKGIRLTVPGRNEGLFSLAEHVLNIDLMTGCWRWLASQFY